MTVKYSDGNDKTSPTDCKSPNQVSGSGGGWGELSLHPNRQSNTLVKGEMHFKAPGPFYYKTTEQQSKTREILIFVKLFM